MGKISVAIATYNGEKFIEEQLASILNQTKSVDEVCICDDRSSDNTVSVVNAFIEKNGLTGSWSIEINEKNLGYASNFMKALRKTTGDIVFFCDQDDIWVNDRVEKMVDVLENTKGALMIGSEFEPFATSANAQSVPEWELKLHKNDDSVEKMSFNSTNIFIGCQGCTMAMKREFLDRVDSYWYEGWAHDEYVWKMALVLDGLFMYHRRTIKRRLHENNASLGKVRDINKRLKYVDELKKSHEATMKFVVDNNLGKAKEKKLNKHIKATTMRARLLRDKKLLNVIPLTLIYSDCYHKRRAIPVELMMAIKN